MAYFCSGDFAVREAPASLKQCIEAILHIDLKQSYCEFCCQYLQFVQSYFHLSLSSFSALAEN